MTINHETQDHRVLFVKVPDDTDFTNLHKAIKKVKK